MSDRHTSATSPDGTHGIVEWGRKTRPEMVQVYRDYYRHQLKQAIAALAFGDDQIVVETFVGVHVQKRKEIVQ